MPRDVERFWRTTQNLRRFNYGPRPATLQQVSNAGYITGNQPITLSGDVTGTGATAITVELTNTGVLPGSYTNSSITVDEDGRVTAAASGAAALTGVTAGTGITVSGAPPSPTVALTTPVSVVNGGTGGTTAAGARTALGAVNIAGDTMTGPLTVTASPLTVSVTTGSDAKVELHNGTTSDWVLSSQGFSSPGEFWIYNNKTSTLPLRISQTDLVTLSAGLNVGGAHTFTILMSSGGYTVLLSPDSPANQQGGVLIGGSGDPQNYYRNDQHTFANRTAAALQASFTPTGTYNNSGSWIAYSDASIKQDVRPYRRGLDAILALEPVEFRYSPGTPFAGAGAASRLLYGLVADQVRAHIPEIVGRAPGIVRGEEVELDTLTPGDLIYSLINSVKTLAAQNAELSGRVKELEAARA